jgi:hypothetical protein
MNKIMTDIRLCGFTQRLQCLLQSIGMQMCEKDAHVIK